MNEAKLKKFYTNILKVFVNLGGVYWDTVRRPLHIAYTAYKQAELESDMNLLKKDSIIVLNKNDGGAMYNKYMLDNVKQQIRNQNKKAKKK